MEANDKITIFRNLFKGRGDAFGAGEGLCIKANFTDTVLLNHFQGKLRVGMYPLSPDILDGKGVYWACIDIDTNGKQCAIDALSKAAELGISVYPELSGGYTHSDSCHVWAFFSNPIQAWKARALLAYIGGSYGEIFPKQNGLKPNGYGNYVSLPLFGPKVKEGRTVFCDENIQTIPDQFSFLESIQKITPEQLNLLIDANALSEIAEQNESDVKLYEKNLEGAGEGERHDTMLSMVGRYVTKGLNKAEVRGFIDQWNTENDPPLTAQRLEKEFEDGWEYCQKKNSGAVDVPESHYTGYHLTDMGNGERLAYHYGPNLHYCYGNKTWYIWNGMQWEGDKAGNIDRLAKDTVRRIYREAADCPDTNIRKAISDHARRSEAVGRINALCIMCQSEDGIPVMAEKLDARPMLLNCLNGTLDLQTGELLSHSKDDLITKLIPIEYKENAKSELWDSFLHTITDGDQALVEFLQRSVGYSLTGDTREEKLFFIHGPAAAGKSTFIEAIKGIMSDYSVTADFDSFIKKPMESGPRNDIATLAGARLVVSIEVDEGKRLAEGLVKLLTGGDTVRARFLYHESFEFLPQFKLWLVANHAPSINAFDGAMWRRILRIPFEHSIPEADRDETVKARLKDLNESGQAILAWAVKGCLNWQEKGLAIPERVRKATAEYRADMDILAAFVNEVCIINQYAKVTKSGLYEKYQDWCKTAGERPDGKITFGRRLLESGYSIKEDKVRIGNETSRFWFGIGLLADTN